MRVTIQPLAEADAKHSDVVSVSRSLGHAGVANGVQTLSVRFGIWQRLKTGCRQYSRLDVWIVRCIDVLPANTP